MQHASQGVEHAHAWRGGSRSTRTPPLGRPPTQVLPFEQQYLDALPSAHMYEKSYMHRDIVTHALVRRAAASGWRGRAHATSSTTCGIAAAARSTTPECPGTR